MNLKDIITTSYRNLFRQKARTILTIASMMIGAFLISIMLSVGNGLKTFMISQVTLFANTKTISVQKDFDLAGTFGMQFGSGIQQYVEEEPVDNVIVPETIPVEDQSDGSRLPPFIQDALLTTEDLEKIRKVDGVAEVTFQSYVSSDYVRLDDSDDSKLVLMLYGVSSAYLDDLSYTQYDAKLLQTNDAIILSDNYAEAWGKENSDLIGETVWVRVTQTGEYLTFPSSRGSNSSASDQEMKEFAFVIAGFFEKSIFAQIGFIMPARSSEINAYIAGRPVDEFLQTEKGMELLVIVDDEENVQTVDTAIEDLGYQSTTFDESIGQIGVVFGVINTALSSFGIIAMLVASIGIANTLMMAIYERTREIGVMKAVGATRFVIGALFTAEAAWLGLFGGFLGLIISWLLGRLANLVLHRGIIFGETTIMEGYLAAYPTFDISVFNVEIIGIVLGLTTVVATIAGLYPAWRASKLDPIHALRHD